MTWYKVTTSAGECGNDGIANASQLHRPVIAGPTAYFNDVAGEQVSSEDFAHIFKKNNRDSVVTAECHAAFAGKYSPDIENVRAVALPILRHRIVCNYKAEAEDITVERLVGELV